MEGYVLCCQVMEWLGNLGEPSNKSPIIGGHPEESPHTLHILRSWEVPDCIDDARVRLETIGCNYMSQVFDLFPDEHTLRRL